MALTEKFQRLPPRRRLAAAALAALAVGAGLWAVRTTLSTQWGGGPGHVSGTGEGRAPLLRRGGAIFVPEGSPYRSRIAVAPVQQKSIRRSRVVTGTVEADLTRTVKVLAPVAGRVGALNVALGDTVKKGPQLATIDSGDLAQAVADAEKARATVKLTTSAMERAVGLNVADVSNLVQIGGGGASIGQIYVNDRSYDMTVRYPPQSRNSPEVLSDLFVKTATNAQIPLSQIANVTLQNGESAISREKTRRVLTVRVDYADRDLSSYLAEAQKRIAQTLRYDPAAVNVVWSGKFENAQQIRAFSKTSSRFQGRA